MNNTNSINDLILSALLEDIARIQATPLDSILAIDVPTLSYRSLLWQHCSLNQLQNLPFTRRFDVAVMAIDTQPKQDETLVRQGLVRLRDLFAKRIIVITSSENAKLLHALGFSKLETAQTPVADTEASASALELWQFNILHYKQVPDWLNAKFWANPENFNKYRW